MGLNTDVCGDYYFTSSIQPQFNYHPPQINFNAEAEVKLFLILQIAFVILRACINVAILHLEYQLTTSSFLLILSVLQLCSTLVECMQALHW